MPKAAAGLFVLVATLLVGWIDYAVGIEVRVLALYFMPLLAAGWWLGTAAAVLTAVFSTAVWLTAQFASGQQFQSPLIWVVNAITEGTGFVVVALLVSRLRDALRRERLLSSSDPLTGLANRRSFEAFVGQSLALGRRHGWAASLAYVDLDNFKQVNDSVGHERGDALLCHFAVLIKSSVRSSDIVARIGGDEFAVFLPEADAESAYALIERVRLAAQGSAQMRAHGVTTSIGIVTDGACASSVGALLRQADALMYQVKRRGKNAVVVQA